MARPSKRGLVDFALAPIKLRVTRKILVWVALSGLITLSSSIYLIERAFYQHRMAELHDEVELITHGQAIILANLLASEDHESLLAALSGTLAHPDIVGIELIVNRLAEVTQFGMVDSGSGELTQVAKTITGFVDDDFVNFGQLNTYFSDQRIIKSLVKRASNMALMVGSVLAATVLVAVIAVFRVVGQPLAKLIDAIRQGQNGQLVTIDGQSDDEIGEVIAEFNAFQEIKRRRIEGLELELTERERSEAQRMRILVDAAFEGIMIVRGKQVIDANDAMCALLRCDIATLMHHEVDRWMTGLLDTVTGHNSLSGPASNNGEAPAQETKQVTIACFDGFERIAEIHWRSITHMGMAAHVVAMRDVTGRVAKENQVRHLAMHDDLTGLPNRRSFMQSLDEMLNTNGPDEFSIFAIDLDRFKQVNDQLGHAAGDELLVKATQKLRSIMPSDDILGRLGGDEFAAIIKYQRLERDQLEELAGQMIALLSREFQLDAGTCKIGMSAGIAHFPHDATDRDGLLKQADNALYAAKRSGRGQVAFACDLRGPSKMPEVGARPNPKSPAKARTVAHCK